MMFLDCPAYLDGGGALRCGLPAEVEDRATMRSTDGPVEILKIRCPAGHWFNGPLESLIPPAQVSVPVTAGPGPAAVLQGDGGPGATRFRSG